MSSKPWRSLQSIKQVVIKPEDPKKDMWIEYVDDTEYDYDPFYEGNRMPVSRDHAIKLGANAMFTVEMDYPEEFKKLVAATGDCTEAYRLYQALQKKAPDNWADYDEGNVW